MNGPRRPGPAVCVLSAGHGLPRHPPADGRGRIRRWSRRPSAPASRHPRRGSGAARQGNQEEKAPACAGPVGGRSAQAGACSGRAKQLHGETRLSGPETVREPTGAARSRRCPTRPWPVPVPVAIIVGCLRAVIHRTAAPGPGTGLDSYPEGAVPAAAQGQSVRPRHRSSGISRAGGRGRSSGGDAPGLKRSR